MVSSEQLIVVNVVTQATAGIDIDLQVGSAAAFDPKAEELYFVQPDGNVFTVNTKPFLEYLSIVPFYAGHVKISGFETRYCDGDRLCHDLAIDLNRMKEGDFCKFGDDPHPVVFNPLPPPTAEEDEDSDEEEEDDREYNYSKGISTNLNFLGTAKTIQKNKKKIRAVRSLKHLDPPTRIKIVIKQSV